MTANQPSVSSRKATSSKPLQQVANVKINVLKGKIYCACCCCVACMEGKTHPQHPMDGVKSSPANSKVYELLHLTARVQLPMRIGGVQKAQLFPPPPGTSTLWNKLSSEDCAGSAIWESKAAAGKAHRDAQRFAHPTAPTKKLPEQRMYFKEKEKGSICKVRGLCSYLMVLLSGC